MGLPNYFLADLPPEAELTPTMLSEACITLKRNRDRYLAHRSTASLIRLLSDVAQAWLKPENTFRQLALAIGPAATGFGRPTLERGLDACFRELTPEAFAALLEQDLGHGDRLERFCATAEEENAGRRALACGPPLLAHITAGNVPSPTLTSIVLGVLLRSAQFVKCATGTSLLPRLFAHSLYETDPKLGACIEVAEWRGGSELLDSVVFEQADCITATGSDETLAAVRQRVSPRARFVGYGHKVSFGYVAADILSGFRLRECLERAADDIVAWNQLGCLSPHSFYVQEGGTVSPELFAEALADTLESREQAEPRGDLAPKTAASIFSRRSIYELRAAHSPGTRLWSSRDSTAWTVVYEADPSFQFSCLHRFVYVKSVSSLTEALQGADAVRGKVSTVGLAAPEHQFHELATELALWGASRVCPLGRMQCPPLPWRHDGSLPLGELVSWTDLELHSAHVPHRSPA